MPKKGITLPDKAVKVIKHYLKINKVSQSEFAEQLQTTPRTLTNWLSGRSTIDQDKIDKIAEILGIGLENLFDSNIPKEYIFHEEAAQAIWRIYKSGLAALGQRTYEKIVELFKEHVAFVIPPKKGFFRTFKYDLSEGKNYYFQFWIISEDKVAETKFTMSFTIANIVRIDYGEFIVKQDIVEVKQYYQPSNYQVKRPTGDINAIKVATWLDELPHTFVVVSDIPFEIEIKGEISEKELKESEDIVIFWKHFFFHS
jgi:transcriptional regulator with XRE-family HTH domain